MIRSGRRSPRFRRSSGVRRRRCASGYVRPIPASAGMTCDRGGRAGLSSEERRRLKELERENRELRRANEILRKASAYLSTFGRQHHHHSRRRSTSAAREDGVVHRRSSGSIRGRAGLRASAARPIDGLRTQSARRGAGARPGAGASRRVAVRVDPPGVRRALRGLRGTQGLAPASPRGGGGGALHACPRVPSEGGAADAPAGAARSCAGPAGEDHARGSAQRAPR